MHDRPWEWNEADSSVSLLLEYYLDDEIYKRSSIKKLLNLASKFKKYQRQRQRIQDFFIDQSGHNVKYDLNNLLEI